MFDEGKTMRIRIFFPTHIIYNFWFSSFEAQVGSPLARNIKGNVQRGLAEPLSLADQVTDEVPESIKSSAFADGVHITESHTRQKLWEMMDLPAISTV
ncbi:uncharacterized protein KY384_003104 [Bacidia gigantensis]|uniref:uncharacterized protein n=1 Tax=Bacidia gigantensis TaxID=2732470 RepID=UPI001D0376C0|nr:uncharacterized protein KY384_003104 [Bacidia gigantensis]KAG8531475.1 hypothetical protein KY384_003104 [Bacidia gigantensis]